MMGADNQAERVIRQLEREELMTAAGRLIRELERSSSLSENAIAAMLDVKRIMTLRGYAFPQQAAGGE